MMVVIFSRQNSYISARRKTKEKEKNISAADAAKF